MVQTLRIGLLFQDNKYDIELIRQQLAPHQVDWLDGCCNWDTNTLTSTIRQYDAIVTARQSPALPDSLRDDLGRLRLLAHCHGTIKHLVSRPHIEAGLMVSNWGDQVAGVAESALSLLLSCLKQLSALNAFVRNDWKDDQRIPAAFPATLSKRDVGLYGFGPIGRHMARMLQPLGPHIAIYDPYATDVPEDFHVCGSLRELFSRCQCISIHCGLNAATEGSVNRELLELLPQGGIVINTARGPIIVEEDLAALVQEGRLRAGIDVINDERNWPTSPLATTHPDAAILTGHTISGAGKRVHDGQEERKGLPDHVAHNVHALADNAALINTISAQVYDLKT
ncbi:MAG: hypothetical protein EA401_01920 [Planctomycetota bacterium]|nr:MAG: hypothetical protein EA401_01920 [Planctomycetota bacterium]